MEPTLIDIIDLLGAVAADLEDVASRLAQAPKGVDPLAVARIELATVTTADDELSHRIAAVHQAIAVALGAN